MKLPLLRQMLSALSGFNRKPGVPLRRKSYRLTLETLEDRLTPSTITVYPSSTPGSAPIQAAVNAAKPGDTIVVKPGTYTEQVWINNKDNLTLTTQGPDATIQSPGFTVTSTSQIDSAYVVRITGSHGVTINDFNINGDAGATTEYGIKVDGGASVYIANNNVTHIVGPSISGLGGGAGIDIGESNAQTSGRGIIVNNTVTGYGRVGIVIDGTGSQGAVAYNFVQGLGSNAPEDEYGIQVSFGANAEVCGNAVTANTVVVQSAAGILVFDAGNCTSIEDNWTYGNEYGIFIYTTNNVSVDNNFSFCNNNDGIQLQGTNNGWVAFNISANNGQGTGGGDGISVYGSTNSANSANNNVVTNNLIYGNNGNGVTVEDTTGTVVSGNLIYGNASDGVMVVGTVGTQVVANVIVDNGGSGVGLTDASGTSVKFNFIDADDGTTAISGSTTSPGTTTSNNFIVH